MDVPRSYKFIWLGESVAKTIGFLTVSVAMFSHMPLWCYCGSLHVGNSPCRIVSGMLVKRTAPSVMLLVAVGSETLPLWARGRDCPLTGPGPTPGAGIPAPRISRPRSGPRLREREIPLSVPIGVLIDSMQGPLGWTKRQHSHRGIRTGIVYNSLAGPLAGISRFQARDPWV
jgi:hypothetical protein